MKRDKIFAAVFVLMIAIPFALAIFKPAGGMSEAEKRQLAPKPDLKLSIASISSLPRKIDLWFNDHFGFRALLAHTNHNLEFKLLGISKRVIVGNDGWLFLKRGRSDTANLRTVVRDLCGDAPLSKAQLDGWVNSLELNRQRAQRVGARYLFVVVPNKHTIYHRYLPPSVACEPGRTRLDQLADRLNALNAFPWVDLRKTFAGNDDTLLYHKTDSHWNANGALAAYQEIARWMGGKVRFDPVAIDTQIEFVDEQTEGGDLARLAGLQGSMTDLMQGFEVRDRRTESLGNPYPQLKRGRRRQPKAFRRPDDQYDNAVIFHDSFFDERVQQLYAESFSETHFVWAGNPVLPLEILKPDHGGIVIHEMVERNLMRPRFFRTAKAD